MEAAIFGDAANGDVASSESKKFHLDAEKSPRSRPGIVAMAEDDSDVWMQGG
jgi:hypothetical protein